MAERNQQDIEKKNRSNITLSAPWEGGLQNIAGWDTQIYDHFIIERTRLHEIYIREQEKSKRIGLSLASLLILSSALILLFALDGREFLSYWISTALIIFAAGAAGFGRVWGKAASISFGADQDKRGLDK